jgi:hypothetical protein
MADTNFVIYKIRLPSALAGRVHEPNRPFGDWAGGTSLEDARDDQCHGHCGA